GLTPLLLAQNGAVTNAAAERTETGEIVLTWKADAAPVSVFMSEQPGLDAAEMERLAKGVTESRFEVTQPDSVWRPYFLIQPDAGGEGVRVAERVLPLEGGRNFRDLGGYPAADGRHVRWGMAYRSGVLSGLTDADYEHLAGLDIAVVCDFRSSEERESEATVWRGPSTPRVVAWGYSDASDGDMADYFSQGVTPEAMRELMVGLYHQIAYDHAEKYALMFRQLAQGETPLLFHCSAGKDRAGTGAALLLTALGVPREVIVQDYALSERVVDYEIAFADAMAEAAETGGTLAMLAQLLPEVRAPLFRSDPAYIETAFAQLEKNHGSVDVFIRDVMGIDDATLQALRDRLLE
ncbi:MAG: tyrosine-protein phosphatase, partial [Bacteroidota bacterium]